MTGTPRAGSGTGVVRKILASQVAFLAILIVGYVYAYREGALTWA